MRHISYSSLIAIIERSLQTGVACPWRCWGLYQCSSERGSRSSVHCTPLLWLLEWTLGGVWKLGCFLSFLRVKCWGYWKTNCKNTKKTVFLAAVWLIKKGINLLQNIIVRVDFWWGIIATVKCVVFTVRCDFIHS